jgi:DNA polymerase zeta
MDLKNSSDILSFRIVSADHYMSYPVQNVDLRYSEFRGCEIKSVPVIRIFGSTLAGQKLCANIHGVFPYIYIPCSETNPESINQMTYQIASSLDKALNISLGQTHATTQHVFKVSLVKGIPFYGYHKSAHQFFKVYLYNPHFVKRAANLFQNSVILGKMLQPHDSHIPYILKFFIDYNLYGMSWLHVAKQNVTFRSEDSMSKKRAVSEIEIDFNAINILNRHLINLDDSNKAANPGIESIWEDERTRRKIRECEIPLEPPQSQPRKDILETETDQYYRAVLATKVAVCPDETLNVTESFSLSSEGSKSEVKASLIKKNKI